MNAIFFSGPDGVGKSEISTQFSNETGIKRFKVETEKENWMKGTFKNSLSFDMLLPSFVRQTGISFVADRGYACEWVYSQVFGRETDMDLLKQIDERWAELGACHIILLRRDYSKARPDELVDASYLQKLHDKYCEFMEWSLTSSMALYVDMFTTPDGNYDIGSQMKEIYAGLEAFRVKQRYPRVYELIRNGEV